MVTRRTLYPRPEPFDHGFLERKEHRIYYEQCGNPAGKPALFVHGGPGGGDPEGRRFFDPEAYRVVYFEQRGAGRSRPAASLDDNTTWELVGDIEALRGRLEIGQWLVFGGSWGSTLSLAYAESHPEAVSELVLRGIFLLRRTELEWFYQSGARALFPEEWQRFASLIPPAERHDLLAAYHRRLTGDDEDLKLAAAKAWSVWEGETSSLLANAERVERYSDPAFALAFARIETHYFVNGGFFDRETQLLDDVDRIRHIPGVIVHGRYDVVCPVATAWELSRRWPEAELRIVPDAGHSAYEPGITHELVRATDELSRRRDRPSP